VSPKPAVIYHFVLQAENSAGGLSGSVEVSTVVAPSITWQPANEVIGFGVPTARLTGFVSRCCEYQAALGLTAVHQISRRDEMTSVSTVSTPSLSAPDVMSAGPAANRKGHYYEVAFVRFEDTGEASDPQGQELDAAIRCITDVRSHNDHGAIVGVFHGWHHNAEWSDPHFVSFRTMLKARRSRNRAPDTVGHSTSECRSACM
jgi:hypothetical protein